MGNRANRVGRPALLMLLIAAMAPLAGALTLTVQSERTLRTALDGRRERVQETQVSAFSLREQMGMEQTRARVRGWQSMVESETVTTSTRRGRLSAELFSPLGDDGSAPWALVLHGGLGTDHSQVLDVACALSLQGYRVLAPDLYAHGQSEGETASLGIRETEDVLAWIDWIMLEDLDARIVCFGQDEGGVAALLAAAEGLPPAVAAVAADSAYAIVRARVCELLAETGAGGLSGRRLDLAYRLTNGVSIEEGNVAERIAGADVPLLLIHGTGDADVLAWQSEDIAQAAGENAQLLLVEGAGHGMARCLEPQTYYDALLDFF
ncbi:MAG: alpha/beta hydrolase [Candidatus Ventricola sp.]